MYYIYQRRNINVKYQRRINKNIKEELIKFKNELIRKNRINNRNEKDLDDYNGYTKYKGIKDIRYLFNEEDIYNSINNIKYLFNENEDIYYAEKIINHHLN